MGRDLTEKKIAKTLLKLSIPIIGTSFIQMAYNMVDMIWLGRLGSQAVAAVGTASFFTWFGMSFALISKTGAEIGLAQSIGRKDLKASKNYVKNSIQMNIIFGIIYAILLILMKTELISFFKLGNENVIKTAEAFLVISALGTNANFINPLFTGICNASGDSKTPFKINAIGLVFNIIMDPILIFGLGPIPALGSNGAAIATVAAQLIVTLCFYLSLKERSDEYLKVNIFEKINWNYFKEIFKLGFPVGLQNALFAFFAMCIARIISFYGPTAIAVQKVGAQIEAISWMTASGFSTALSAFVGQNYGAGKWKRIYEGYFITLGIAAILGIFTTVMLVFGGNVIFGFFIPEKEAIQMGTTYLRILGYSQLFMCIEITTAGAFNGLGMTAYPSWMSIILTGIRIPLSILFATPEKFGLDGVWWVISATSVLKGFVIVGMLIFIVLIPNKEKILGKSIKNTY